MLYPATGEGCPVWTADSRRSARDVAKSPNLATAPTGERSGIYPLRKRRSLFTPVSGAGCRTPWCKPDGGASLVMRWRSGA